MEQSKLSLRNCGVDEDEYFQAEINCPTADGARVLIVQGAFCPQDLPAHIDHAYWLDTGEAALDAACQHHDVIQELLKAS